MPTPSWQAARNGMPTDTNAVDKSAQINQFLGTHGVTPVYEGNPVLTPNGVGAGTDDPANFWAFHLDDFDYDQPFTMSGTNIGRVLLPLLAIGEGVDVKVSLCNDSSGSPGSVIASIVLPASWIRAFSQVQGLSSTSDVVILQDTDSPLALADYNPLQFSQVTSNTWVAPAVGSVGGSWFASMCVDGSYILSVGGTNADSEVPTNVAFTTAYQGAGYDLSTTLPQPTLPLNMVNAGITVVGETVVVVGGSTEVDGPYSDAAYVAAWDSGQGVIGAWSAQTTLPVVVADVGCAASLDTNSVYVVGGITAFDVPLATVFWATISNGQLGAWNSGPSLPAAVTNPIVTVAGGFLVVAGGQANGGAANNGVLYAAIYSDGSLGSWQSAPNLPVGVFPTGSTPTLDSGMVMISGETGSGSTTAMETLAIRPTGPARAWNRGTFPPGPTVDLNATAFTLGPGQSMVFAFDPESAAYYATAIYTMPRISVPLPVSGLTNGTGYHILLQQQGGDGNDYLRSCVDFHALPGNPTALFRQRGTSGAWSSYFTGFSIPIEVYDQTPGGQPLHTWEDSGARITTLAYATTPDARLLGIAESTVFADGTLDAAVCTVDYPGTWPGSLWPPESVTQL